MGDTSWSGYRLTGCCQRLQGSVSAEGILDVIVYDSHFLWRQRDKDKERMMSKKKEEKREGHLLSPPGSKGKFVIGLNCTGAEAGFCKMTAMRERHKGKRRKRRGWWGDEMTFCKEEGEGEGWGKEGREEAMCWHRDWQGGGFRVIDRLPPQFTRNWLTSINTLRLDKPCSGCVCVCVRV